MACTIAVARHGLHHSFVRICQALRVALERSALARILGWLRLTAFWLRGSRAKHSSGTVRPS